MIIKQHSDLQCDLDNHKYEKGKRIVEELESGVV